MFDDLENTFRKFVEHVITTFVICGVFVDICLFLLQKLLQLCYYCNWLFHNIAIKAITKLKRVHNWLAWLVTRSPRFIHSKPLPKSLHWLPFRCRIIFKICTVTYQALSCKQPSYLHSLLTPVRKPVQLRSSSSYLLVVLKVNISIGTRDLHTFTTWLIHHSSLAYQSI